MFNVNVDLSKPLMFNAADVQAAYKSRQLIEGGLSSLSKKTVSKWWANEYNTIEQNSALSTAALDRIMEERKEAHHRLR